ncbi:uncharacterized protein V1516DRAFT_669781 [Lipomyces oligophaga]|uniref:uncharacterized protein n=1 Tax=Lipomyces oligophaga TaxID=45792 RepID=UPI0034CE10B6
MTYLDDLPGDVWVHICAHLQDSDVVSLKLTSKRLQSLVLHPEIWRWRCKARWNEWKNIGICRKLYGLTHDYSDISVSMLSITIDWHSQYVGRARLDRKATELTRSYKAHEMYDITFDQLVALGQDALPRLYALSQGEIADTKFICNSDHPDVEFDQFCWTSFGKVRSLAVMYVASQAEGFIRRRSAMDIWLDGATDHRHSEKIARTKSERILAAVSYFAGSSPSAQLLAANRLVRLAKKDYPFLMEADIGADEVARALVDLFISCNTLKVTSLPLEQASNVINFRSNQWSTAYLFCETARLLGFKCTLYSSTLLKLSTHSPVARFKSAYVNLLLAQSGNSYEWAISSLGQSLGGFFQHRVEKYASPYSILVEICFLFSMNYQDESVSQNFQFNELGHINGPFTNPMQGMSVLRILDNILPKLDFRISAGRFPFSVLNSPLYSHYVLLDQFRRVLYMTCRRELDLYTTDQFYAVFEQVSKTQISSVVRDRISIVGQMARDSIEHDLRIGHIPEYGNSLASLDAEPEHVEEGPFRIGELVYNLHYSRLAVILSSFVMPRQSYPQRDRDELFYRALHFGATYTYSVRRQNLCDFKSVFAGHQQFEFLHDPVNSHLYHRMDPLTTFLRDLGCVFNSFDLETCSFLPLPYSI